MKKIIFTIVFILSFISSANPQYGYKWVLKQSGTLSNLYGECFSNSSQNNYAGFVCGSNGTFLVSTDGYNTWVSKSPGVNVTLYSASLAYPIPFTNSVVCCGENGTVFYTTNMGNNWTQLNSGTTAQLNCIIKSGTSLIAVGNNGVIVKSTWSGSAYPPFTVINSGTSQNLKSIVPGNGDTNLYACGNNGTILKSTNRGNSWSSISFPAAYNLNSISFLWQQATLDVLEVCGNNGVFYRTTNGGLIWTSYPTGVSVNLNNQMYPYIFGNSGTVLYNLLAYFDGVRWRKYSVPTSADLNYAEGLHYIAVGSNGTILKRESDSALLATNINANNINTYLIYRGIFDQYIYTTNTPGFEWPKGSNKHVIYTTGLSASCKINNQLAQTMCSYKGEYQPGAIINGLFNDSDIFKIYKVSRTENPPGNDWLNWGCMVPFGAPYVDVNNNGIYEPLVDTPGVKNASQTIFACLTDYNPDSHTSGEGFGGGITSPLMGVELHLTKWSYTYPSFNDVTFSKFEIINKGGSAWNNTYFAFVSDIDIGSEYNDWVGCDTIRNMGYGYNSTDNDPQYGTAPPAVGFDVLKGPINKRVYPNAIYNMTSFSRFLGGEQPPYSESAPDGEPYPAYLYMKGYKKDTSVWLDRTQPTPWGSYKKTKKIFYGDPETNEGWTSAKGYILNYMRDTIGTQNPESPNDKRITLGMGADNYTMYNGDTAVIWLAQLVARGTNNLNSVTKLKQLSDITQTFFESNFTIGINKISTAIPERYSLSQNYPNPFNPITKIKYSITGNVDVKLTVYDVLGRKIKVLVNEKQSPGIYEVTFDGTNFSSGVYFYRIEASNFSETKKMLVIK
jgi:photosystem II stability/assembly factor-like uncharacterized protein